MTTSFNPMHYLNHAWQGTNSPWGKASIVLFYSFIWVQILWAVQVLIAPTAGWDCFFEGSDHYSKAMVVGLVRQMNIFTIGFLLYADRGGIKVWNVATVFVVFLIWTLAWRHGIMAMQGAKGAPSCPSALQTSRVLMWVTDVWSGLALLTSYLETQASGGSTAGETTPLVT